MRALVAMSGGVDSSVAAALMLEAGYDVIGVTLKQWVRPCGELPTAGCCTASDADDARRVAAMLDVPYTVLDYVDEFTSAVVDPFGRQYMAGRTPNPCIECNRTVRFSALLDQTTEFDADVLVTGHHARVAKQNGVWQLLRAVDGTKDQSYVLHMLGQDALSRIRLPVGEMTKAEVRKRAAALGMPTADKPDSQDICFVPSGDYRDFLADQFPETAMPGPIVDSAGTVLGEHGGVAGFTIGQRKGLGIAVGEARYVIGIEPTERLVVIGTHDELLTDGCIVSKVTWVAGEPPAGPDVSVKVRYRTPAVAASITRSDGDWEVRFTERQPAPAPGQSAVFYEGDRVLGGGIIEESIRL
ncbi:MAG: tRNA 2-thiouridine(34) synthase MnmA [Actinomycetota bacterium]